MSPAEESAAASGDWSGFGWVDGATGSFCTIWSPICAVFNFHHTPAANAAAMTTPTSMNTIQGRWDFSPSSCPNSAGSGADLGLASRNAGSGEADTATGFAGTLETARGAAAVT